MFGTYSFIIALVHANYSLSVLSIASVSSESISFLLSLKYKKKFIIGTCESIFKG